jgi:hypothetical protein
MEFPRNFIAQTPKYLYSQVKHLLRDVWAGKWILDPPFLGYYDVMVF